MRPPDRSSRTPPPSRWTRRSNRCRTWAWKSRSKKSDAAPCIRPYTKHVIQKGENRMKARLPKGYGRPDPQAMMRQVQKMQDDIRAKQAELEAREYTGTASGELVSVTMTGKHEVTAVKIK